MGHPVLQAPPVRARRAGTEDPSAQDVLDRPGSADRDLGRSGQPAARLTSARRIAGRSSSFRVRRGRSPQYHPDRYSSGPVRGSGTADLSKAKALVEAPGGIVGPHAEAKAKPAASGLADQRAHELLAHPLAASLRFHADRHLRSFFVPVGVSELCVGEAPCPGRAEALAVLFGDEPEIPRSLPANEILRYERNRFCRLCMGFIGGHREQVPQNFQVILDSRTDHQIAHPTSLTWLLAAAVFT